MLPEMQPMFFERAMQLIQTVCKELLGDFPEMQSIAVTVAWAPPLENIPSAVVTGRNGPLEGPSEIIRAQQQLLLLQQFLHSKQVQLLHATDAAMAAKADQLVKLEKSIGNVRNASARPTERPSSP